MWLEERKCNEPPVFYKPQNPCVHLILGCAWTLFLARQDEK